MKNLINLTDSQNKAINAFLDFLVNDENYFTITGSAGTGKSFLVKHLLQTFYSKYSAYCLLLQKDIKEFNVCITATTNKATNVLKDFLSDVASIKLNTKVTTIYSLLNLRVSYNKNTGETELINANRNVSVASKLNTANTNLIFIDEASFIDEKLQKIIELNVKEHNAKIVYIGDKYQLAPVGQTYTVFDSVAGDKIELTEIVRNHGNILATGMLFKDTVKTDKFIDISYDNKEIIHTSGEEFKRLIEKEFSQPNWNTSKSKVIAWTNERVQEYNAHIRNVLHKPKLFSIGETVITNNFISSASSRHAFKRSIDSEVVITKVDTITNTIFGVDGRMIEIDNNFISFMPYNYSDAKKLMNTYAKNKDWSKYFEVKNTWFDLRAVYACSVHKAQGSTYENVFIDLSDIGSNWCASDVARLMYVAITRASKKVICYGELPYQYRGG